MATTSGKKKGEGVIVLKGGRFSYAHVWEPKAMKNEDGTEDPKNLRYSVSYILDKKKDAVAIEKIEALIDAKIVEGKDILKGKHKASKNFKYPLRDGAEEREDDPVYKNCMFLNISSSEKPQIVDKNVDPILDKEEFYSGCYGNVSFRLYAFNKNGGFGIGCGLSNLQKTKDGEPLTSRTNAEDDFSVVDDDDEDDSDSVI